MITRGFMSIRGDKNLWRRLAPLAVALFSLGCGSAGPYGHAREYAPLGPEKKATEGAVDYDPVMAQRMPDQWQGKLISVFGVVKKRNAGQSGASKVTLSVRTLEDRNLCENKSTDSCRVTVSEREHAVVHAMLKLDGDDDIGPRSVGIGSLVRVVGKIRDTIDNSDGNPVVQAEYYRHWPRNYFVTTAARKDMRR